MEEEEQEEEEGEGMVRREKERSWFWIQYHEGPLEISLGALARCFPFGSEAPVVTLTWLYPHFVWIDTQFSQQKNGLCLLMKYF